ncbi:MAG: 30S ribosomal protein S15 [Euryarchaeota archaeon]|nr:30S ribosomal protein S15 [Euryarchaeota archaeon]
MARMHARRRGSSSSTRPLRTANPEWVPVDSAEVTKLVAKMAKEGLTSAQIGTRLRDQYGVPSVRLATGKSVLRLMKESGLKLDFPEDVRNLMKRAVRLSGHLSGRPRDLHNRRRLQLVESKIRRLVKYYHGTGALPEDWNYSLETAKLLVE